MSVDWSEPNDPTDFAPKREGTKFVCESCPCGEVQLGCSDDGNVYAVCDHMVQTIRDGVLIHTQTRGVRH